MHMKRTQGFPGGKESVCQGRRGKRLRFHPWVGKIPRGRQWQPTQVFLPGESQVQKSLVGSWGGKGSDLTEHAGSVWYIHIYKGALGQEYPLGEGTGNPPVFLPGELHGQKSLGSYSPQGFKGSDITEPTWCVGVTYICIYIHTCTHTYEHTYIHIHYMYINVHIYIYTHTHTYTGGLQSIASRRVGQDWATTYTQSLCCTAETYNMQLNYTSIK